MRICRDVKLKIDEWAGEGDVTVSDQWHEYGDLFRADVAGDWLYDILRLYNQARKECFGTSDYVLIKEDQLQQLVDLLPEGFTFGYEDE